jgi:hypothetical protein
VKFELGLAALENFIGKHLNFEEVLRLSAPRGCRKQHRAERDDEVVRPASFKWF